MIANEAIEDVKQVAEGALNAVIPSANAEEVSKTATSIYVKNNNKDLGYGVRNDPTQGDKGDGFIAGKHTVTRDDGEEVQVTEYTVGVEIDGKIVDVPSINTYTTEEDMKAILESVRTGKPLPKEIEEKAKKHALDRIDAGKSIYLEDGEEQVPFAIDRFGGAKDLTGEVENLKKANIKKHFNNKLVALIKKQEGNPQLIARKLFKDEKYPTSGYGRNNESIKEGDVITQKQADVMLQEDIDIRLIEINKTIPKFNEFPEELQLALFGEYYRGSIGQSPKTLKLINQGEYSKAATEYLDNDEYRNAIPRNRRGILKNMKKISDLLNKYEKNKGK